jgi:HSP20 family protein
MSIERWRPFGSVSLWEPFSGIDEIQSEMNRMFDGLFARPPVSGVTERAWAPNMDVYETKDDMTLVCDLPGVRENEVTVSIMGDVLTVKGERKLLTEPQDDNYHRLERWFGKFERRVVLPMPVQADGVKASYRDGVLEIRLPKAEEVKPREIKIDLP